MFYCVGFCPLVLIADFCLTRLRRLRYFASSLRSFCKVLVRDCKEKTPIKGVEFASFE